LDDPNAVNRISLPIVAGHGKPLGTDWPALRTICPPALTRPPRSSERATSVGAPKTKAGRAR